MPAATSPSRRGKRNEKTDDEKGRSKEVHALLGLPDAARLRGGWQVLEEGARINGNYNIRRTANGD